MTLHFFILQVRRTSAEVNLLKEAAVGSDSSMSKLIQSGDIRQAIQLANAVLTNLNKRVAGDITAGDKEEVCFLYTVLMCMILRTPNTR